MSEVTNDSSLIPRNLLGVVQVTRAPDLACIITGYGILRTKCRPCTQVTKGRLVGKECETNHLTLSPAHPPTLSPSHPLTHSLSHPLTHSPTHSLTHSLTHPLILSPSHLAQVTKERLVGKERVCSYCRVLHGNGFL